VKVLVLVSSGSSSARELIGAFLNARFTDEARHRRRLALENPLRAAGVRLDTPV
jgi:hypothetical protein